MYIGESNVALLASPICYYSQFLYSSSGADASFLERRVRPIDILV